MTGEEERFLYLLAAQTLERESSLDSFEGYIRAKYETELKNAGLFELHLQSITVFVPGGLQLNFVSRSVMFEDIVDRTPNIHVPWDGKAPQI